jgi:hypothetical protein
MLAKIAERENARSRMPIDQERLVGYHDRQKCAALPARFHDRNLGHRYDRLTDDFIS